jgi:peptide/nickel transport system ATP-binding protein
VEQDRLAAIEGQVPTPTSKMQGCRFAPRCPFADAHCRTAEPPLTDLGDGHQAACWKVPLNPSLEQAA